MDKPRKGLLAAGLTSVGLILIAISIVLGLILLRGPMKMWQFQSIDTMKYSRDLAREKLAEKAFDDEIDRQMKLIANTGATHVAIGTPYDEEFLPFLRRWVSSARKNGLSIWFRGNFSGWEGWFGYEKIDRNEHKKLTEEFILDNQSLFQNGDIFSACPECENGGHGDPRMTRDVKSHQNFLIEEYEITKKAFQRINKKVASNFASMNYDVALLVMDPETTKKLGGVITIDHYVASPEKLNDDVTKIANKGRGKVFLGEFGVPIPDIHGQMSEVEQAEWLEKTLSYLSNNENMLGLNYWVGFGGSTQIWHENGSPKAAVDVMTKYFNN